MSDKVAEIPQEIRDKIAEYIKASLPAWDNPRQIDAEFGYSLAQQEIAAKDKSIEILRIERDNYFEANSGRMKELAKAKNEIERLNKLLKNFAHNLRLG